jgi:uncharacterized protein (DUF1800 family)
LKALLSLAIVADSPEDFMTAQGKEAAALALHRFGFGPKLGDGAGGYSITAIAADPRGALLSDLDRPRAGQLLAELPSSAQAARAVADFRAEQHAKQKLAQRAMKLGETKDEGPATAVATSAATAAAPSGAKPSEKQPPPLPQRIIEDEAAARIDAAVDADIGFVERLVWFWSNHFCVSADKDVAMVGAYEREAVRAHVLGHFGDLLLAVESHPAMLFYLDNVQSMGANSVNGINRDKGLNENLAREILELHTLGVNGGYSQADVTSFANVLTGWTWVDPNDPEHGGEFLFNPRLHEPGEQKVCGRVYPDSGVAAGRLLLHDLARHPATARHISEKLARHFIADAPPPSLVAKLTRTYLDTDGHLKSVARTLVTADESWWPQRPKLKKPSEWLAGVLRLAKAAPPARAGSSAVIDLRTPQPQHWPIGRVLNAQAMLGEALWRPPAPNGYPDTEAAWIGGVPRRLDVATDLAAHLPMAVDPLDLIDLSLGPLASPETRQTIARAETRAQAFALLAMAPEFLRR